MFVHHWSCAEQKLSEKNLLTTLGRINTPHQTCNKWNPNFHSSINAPTQKKCFCAVETRSKQWRRGTFIFILRCKITDPQYCYCSKHMPMSGEPGRQYITEQESKNSVRQKRSIYWLVRREDLLSFLHRYALFIFTVFINFSQTHGPYYKSNRITQEHKNV